MKKALLFVDYNYDFVADDGSLTSGAAGQALDEHLLALVKKTLADDDFVFICNDAHDPHDQYDPEAPLFPAHCRKGTKGGELFGESGKLLLQRYAEHDPHVSYIPKLRYSAFFGTPLDSMLRARGVEEVIVVGVCTDICVLHTVISAVYAGYKVTVPANCCATIIPGGQEWALAHMKGCLGVNVIE